MAGKKGVAFKEGAPSFKEIPGRHEIAGVGVVFNPFTGKEEAVEFYEEDARRVQTQQPEERSAAAAEARAERQKTSRERGYKFPDEARQYNKSKRYNPFTGKWEGGRTRKKRRTTKRRKTHRK